MKRWSDIDPGHGILEIKGNAEMALQGIAFDSRKVAPGFLFVAQKGIHTDGHLYIASAIERGASAVVCEELPSSLPENVLFIKVDNADEMLGDLASAWYDHPSRKIKVIGITGTNGKTSIATLSYRLFSRLGYQAGLISTISTIVGQKTETATHTTPDALKIHSLLNEMVLQGCDYCFMEVSSHAVVQYRISGIHFAGGIFTNLTHDHLDYHKTFDQYLKAKKGFFDRLPSTAFALINMDDKNGPVMLQNCRAAHRTYSVRTMADFRCRVLETHFEGMLITIDGQEVWTHLVGKFNASNLLAVYATALLTGQEREEVLQEISELTAVQGRFDALRSLDGKLAIVDYAHTPDALKNVLFAIAEIRTGNEKVITVVGAGGDRDRTKRPEMAREAVLASDRVILTSDNPRTEDPETIIREMETGIDKTHRNKAISITNRREAIKTACLMAAPGDIILVAGKGHENYQEIMGIKYHFDDKEVIREIFGIE
ncbi:MAG: UDP-N-acetylmuramoyl-L-alanyl-D-glutamate--2,6-diaminopimelate ligase [Prolixibacteraceae bacterium]|jgi:UDP-N-acetylmuramoyl-L-alanyl-D-glutamate--2,6-diaminopimelate ligase|nr:UDP-N-acetylmuramoyl-L-alanyl-D-glutamate--2,6-diaminopimelate ligase [Prolixibacteraceae bacterium]MDI9563881.1 UDP-N-acetylmuramoyl-L-alanyl-D-glutamate--2,6-diaminopimelate ligase [Bacteroidota bacterium]NLS98461.1 UDP-N-acetylmuramoyl-L-alanyl-D-glutamate--2,6-diaminopimelate ligase [Bacteroidales bacterium]OQB82282.1 MAG: UDP-N-acetylmuramoyl-L-alanyl-D-glutamate--LD-lysine ligase [Bacteroidetes bacterium ADurb.Bin123]HNZ69453.1 UDP-N-acetylmuramoyl-L-alanyl-D-glutamate--2,6-diaminopime